MCMPSTRGMEVELSSDAVNAELAQWYIHTQLQHSPYKTGHFLVCILLKILNLSILLTLSCLSGVKFREVPLYKNWCSNPCVGSLPMTIEKTACFPLSRPKYYLRTRESTREPSPS